MVNQRELIGCAVAVVGIPALFYADWKLVSALIVLVLLFGLSCLLGFLAEKFGLILAALLVFTVVISKWWIWEHIAAESNWRTSLELFALMAASVATGGAWTGVFIRRAIDRNGHRFEC
jgi:hypothetical protein